ncbi:hypothetical protein ACI6Q2_13595 [Chitinophagaceae bacterium LWZ2-11]
MSWAKSKEFGAIKIDGKKVYLYETQSQKETINVGEDVADARWAGDAVVVTLRNGKVRRYTGLSQYNNIG